MNGREYTQIKQLSESKDYGNLLDRAKRAITQQSSTRNEEVQVRVGKKKQRRRVISLEQSVGSFKDGFSKRTTNPVREELEDIEVK